VCGSRLRLAGSGYEYRATEVEMEIVAPKGSLVVSDPTPMHLFADTHDTATSRLLGCRSGKADQRLRISRRGAGTARQFVTVGHETPCTDSVPGVISAGGGLTVHAEPFQRSRSVMLADCELPTAMHALPAGHDTALKIPPPPPPGEVGRNWDRFSDHRDPFQRSLSGLTGPPLTSMSPTAMHESTAGHDTASRAASPRRCLSAGGVGVRCSDQVRPFQRATTALKNGELLVAPTATQSWADGQDTPARSPATLGNC
jgi:hypothetical protein